MYTRTTLGSTWPLRLVLGVLWEGVVGNTDLKKLASSVFNLGLLKD